MSRLIAAPQKPEVVWSTRWFDYEDADKSDLPANGTTTIEVVTGTSPCGILNDERLDALSSRVGLRRFVQTEARSHAYAC
jgi:hypothetical protein